jgi:hypothetical protein
LQREGVDVPGCEGSGPIFRVMWGQGIDEDVDTVEYPYDPYSNSTPLSHSLDKQVDAVAIPTTSTTSAGGGSTNLPEEGMRVKVRFERGQFYYGTILTVAEQNGEKGKKSRKRRLADIVIKYDDGSEENAIFPDPDITLCMPGTSSCRKTFVMREILVGHVYMFCVHSYIICFYPYTLYYRFWR